MSTIFDALTSMPDSFTVGEAVSWVETLTDFPCATHSVAYKFAGNTPQDGFQQFAIAGTESGTADYTFTSATALKPGRYQWEKQVTLTAGSIMRVVDTGCITVIPNLATVPTVTYAQSQVTKIQAQLTAASQSQSRSFNGQSSSDFSVGELKEQLVFWQARVIEEQRQINALSGRSSGGRIPLEFVASARGNGCSSCQ